MKKIIAVLAIVVSAGAYAQGYSNTHGNHPSNSHRGSMMSQQMENLTPEQQEEFSKLYNKQTNKMRRSMLDIKEINLKIQKEMLAETPNQKNINKLIDQKSNLQAQRQKDVLNYKIDMKEKFGVEMRGHMGSGNCMTSKAGSKKMNRMRG